MHKQQYLKLKNRGETPNLNKKVEGGRKTKIILSCLLTREP